MGESSQNPNGGRGNSLRAVVTGLVVVLGLLTIISKSAGASPSGGMDVPSTIALAFVAVGLMILLIDAFGLMRARERGQPGESQRPGLSLFVTGLSLALGGMTYAWTGVFWFTIVAIGPPIILGRTRRSGTMER